MSDHGDDTSDHFTFSSTSNLNPTDPTLPNFASHTENPSVDFSTPFYGSVDLRLSPRLSQYPFTDDIFTDAYRDPPQNFLNTILNPAGLDHNRFSPFSYQSALHPFRQIDSLAEDMPPATRARPQSSRPARLPNGYVDLTGTPDLPPQRRKRDSPSPGPSAKRQRRTSGTAASSKPITVEEVDLTDDRQSVHDVLKKQREDAIKSQTRPEEKPTTFSTFTCVICMDLPTDLTATACGHLFCHTCLNEALIAGENRAGPGEQKRSQCPVCRKFINRSKATDIIPLLLKKGLATQPRKKAAAAAASPEVKRRQSLSRPPVRRTARVKRHVDYVEIM